MRQLAAQGDENRSVHYICMVQANKPNLSEVLLNSLRNFHHAVHATEHGDDHNEKGALKLLSYISTCGVQRLSDLPKEIPLDLSTISRHCAALTRDGLLDRTDDPSDRRAVLINVTEVGHKRLDRLQAEKSALLKEATSHWSNEDIEHFTRLLDRMSQDLGKFAKSERSSHRPESK